MTDIDIISTLILGRSEYIGNYDNKPTLQRTDQFGNVSSFFRESSLPMLVTPASLQNQRQFEGTRAGSFGTPLPWQWQWLPPLDRPGNEIGCSCSSCSLRHSAADREGSQDSLLHSSLALLTQQPSSAPTSRCQICCSSVSGSQDLGYPSMLSLRSTRTARSARTKLRNLLVPVAHPN